MVSRLFSFPKEDLTPRLGWLPTVFVIVLAAIPRLSSLRAFIAHDETLYWEWARVFFLSLVQRDWLGTIVGPGNPSVTLFWNHALNMGLKYAWAWLTGIQASALQTWPDFQPQATFDLLVQRRLPIVLFNTLAVVVVYILLRRLYGHRIALVAGVLLALDPFYLADSRTSRGEGLMASLAILALLLYLSYWAFRRYRYLLFSGVATGLALLTKTSAISLVIWAIPVTLIFALVTLDTPWRNRLKLVLVTLVAWGLIAVVTFWVLWPAMWVSPVKVLNFLSSFLSDVGVGGRDNYFFGRIYHHEPLPLYYLVVFALRVTPLAGLGLLGALDYLRHSCVRRRRPDFTDPESLQPLWTLLILSFALIYGVMMTIGTLKRDWYLLPAFPSLDIVAAVGLVWIFERAWDRWGDRWANRVSSWTAWAGALAAVLVLQAATVLPSHPYYYTYWNPVVLGGHWAAQAVMVGWDLDLSAGAHYLNSKPNAEKLWAATHSTRAFQQIFKGQTVRWVPERPWIQADYLVVRRNHLQLQKLDPSLLEYVSRLELDHLVTIGGVDYLWIYKGPRAEYSVGSGTLTGKATLLGYDLGDPVTAAGDTLSLKLYWRNEGMTQDDDLFLRLVDAGDYVWAESVAVPLSGFEEAAVTEDQIVESRVTLTVPVGTPPGTYFFRGGVYNHARQEVLGYFTLPSDGDQIAVVRPAKVLSTTPVSIEHELNLEMLPEVSLLGFDLPDNTFVLSDDNWLVLYWQAEADVNKDYVIGLQLLDSDAEEAAYWLGRPVMSGYPTSEWTAGEIVRDPWRLELPEGVVPNDYTLSVTLFDAENQTAVGQVSLDEVSVVGRRRVYDLPSMQNTLGVSLGDRVTLLGYDLFAEPISGGGRLRVTLYWQPQQTMSISYRVFVRLVGPDGAVAAQHEGIPVEGAIPTDDWGVGEVVADRHLVEFLELAPGEYKLVVGMYDPATGEGLPALEGATGIVLQSIVID
jgi:4-amino-4-deoxy-L-arabinose transferase-like glycosyltransferase